MRAIAILSTAHVHTPGFIRNLQEGRDGRSLHAIWDDDAVRGRAAAVEAGVPFETELVRILNDEAIDGFIICAENSRHLALLEQVLPTGKPVFCEKPLVIGRAEVAALRELHARFPSPLFTGYFLPYTGPMQAALRMVTDGELGTITHARMRMAHHGGYAGWFDARERRWFADPALAGGGALMDLGTHAVHTLRLFLGPVAAVFASTATFGTRYPAVEDTAWIHLKFRSGVQGTAEASWLQTGGINGLEIIGSEGAIWSSPQGLLLGKPGTEPVPVHPVDPVPSRVDRLIEILAGKVPAEALEHDLRIAEECVALIECAQQSAAAGRWIPVED